MYMYNHQAVLDHLVELFVSPPPTIYYIAMGCGKMDFKTWETLVCNFTKGFLRQTISTRGFQSVDYWCWTV